MNRKKVFVFYDIVENKRRRRVFEFLKGYMEPIQKSVFRGFLLKNDIWLIASTLEEEIDVEEDSILIVFPENGDIEEIHIGINEPPEWSEVDIIM